MVSAKSSCRNITCELIPGSPPPFLLFIGVRREPGNEVSCVPSGLDFEVTGDSILLYCLSIYLLRGHQVTVNMTCSPILCSWFAFSIIHGSGRVRKTGKAWSHSSRE